MSEISSGLVAVAEVAFSLHLGLYAAFVGRRQIEVGDKLVRLSDAEAIIAQKAAEIIEQCRINGIGAEREASLLGQIERQSAALKLARRAIDDYLNPCGCSDGCGFCGGKVYLSEALAAIDALGE